jgi:hypothetical protein
MLRLLSHHNRAGKRDVNHENHDRFCQQLTGSVSPTKKLAGAGRHSKGAENRPNFDGVSASANGVTISRNSLLRHRLRAATA